MSLLFAISYCPIEEEPSNEDRPFCDNQVHLGYTWDHSDDSCRTNFVPQKLQRGQEIVAVSYKTSFCTFNFNFTRERKKPKQLQSSVESSEKAVRETRVLRCKG